MLKPKHIRTKNNVKDSGECFKFYRLPTTTSEVIFELETIAMIILPIKYGLQNVLTRNIPYMIS